MRYLTLALTVASPFLLWKLRHTAKTRRVSGTTFGNLKALGNESLSLVFHGNWNDHRVD